MMHAGYPGQFTDTRKKTDCKYHLEGRCSLGEKCPFRHVPELFNSAARVAFAPHSQPSVCHFYLNGKCTKGDLCAFQHPGSQKEMQIDFDDDESPQQTEQGHSAMPDTVKQPRMQGPAASQPKAARQSVPVQSRKPVQMSPPHPQPLSKRLGPQPVALRQPSQKRVTDQEDSAPGNMSVFDRLAGGKAKPAVQSRLSKPSSMEVDSRSVWRPAKRPISDARELLLEAVAAKARVGRKEAELAGRTPSRQARPGTSELEPLSIAQRRVVAVNRGPRASPAHAPKFASPAPIDGTGPRESALKRIAPVHQNGSAASSSAGTPATAPRPRRASLEPFVSSRLRPTPTSNTPSQTPSQTPQATGAASAGVTPASGSVLAATPSSEVSAAGVDRRGRQKITWQPPTASQREDTGQAKPNMSKRKASDAASSPLDAAAASAAAAAAAAEETSPSKRMKAASDPADPPQTSPAPQRQGTSEVPKQEASATAPEASTAVEQVEEEEAGDGADDALDSGLEVDDDDDLAFDEEGDEDEEVLYEDFDDAATMRELEALS